MNLRRFALLLVSPLLLLVALLSIVNGLSFYAATNPAAVIAASLSPATVQMERIYYLAARVLLFPLQIIFIMITFSAALWVFRRRQIIAGWVLGEPVAERLAPAGPDDALPAVFRPERRRTLQQLLASVIAILAIGAAIVLSLGQFVPRGELAVVIAALTSSLTWGARLPIGDLLGGISTLFENNYTVGDRILYRQVDQRVEGAVESVDLRFMAVRTDSGEIVTIPHGDLRIFRNYSRGDQVGVYATFPVAAGDLSRAVALLNELAPDSPLLVPQLVEPWQPMSLEGRLGSVVDLNLYGKTTPGSEDDLQLALHAVVLTRLAAAGIMLQARGGAK